MTVARLATALSNLSSAIREVDALLAETRDHHDQLGSHIFASRRHYRSINDVKSGKRHARFAQTSWHRACELGYRGNLAEWERLLSAGG